MKTFKRLDREVYKYKPDQMILRLNDITDALNSTTISIEQVSTGIGSKEVLVYGNQPDGTFGIVKWVKAGDQYTSPTVVI